MGSDLIQLETRALEIVEQWLPRYEDAFDAALGGVATGKAFIGQCSLYLAGTNLLQKYGPQEVVNAFKQCAAMGLYPMKGYCSLVPFKSSGGGTQLQAIAEWKGLQCLMQRMPGVRKVTPVLIHRTDAYATEGGELVAHTFDVFSGERTFRHPAEIPDDEPPDLVGGYARIRYSDGLIEHHLVPYPKFEKARLCSQVPYKTKRNLPGVWLAHYEEQCLKTVIRNAYARGAVSVDPVTNLIHAEHMAKALEAEDKTLGNDPIRPALLDVTPQSTMAEIAFGKTEESEGE